MSSDVDLLQSWYDALEKRHLSRLTFQEVRRALQALSALYVERREKLPSGAVFEGDGKRAAFAMFYGPLHFVTVQAIVRELNATRDIQQVLDLGCGTGVGGAAWALAASPNARVEGIDSSAWAVGEAEWNCRSLNLQGKFRRGDAVGQKLPHSTTSAVIAAYTVNELNDDGRGQLLRSLLSAGAAGTHVLIVEPIAKRMNKWWPDWEQAFVQAGGRADEWKLPIAMPERWRLLDKAAGLAHREIRARSLYFGPVDVALGPSEP